MTVTVEALTGKDLQAAMDDLARLRIEVFRDYPYLYEGTLDYEANYLSVFASGRDGVIAAARDGDTIIGCATGSGLTAHHEEFARPFLKASYNIDKIFYCGESVLLPHYRGQGLGHAFFDMREAHAKKNGYTHCTFCAVVRPGNHPLKPQDYSPLDAFWQKRGYRKMPGLTASFSWKDIGEPHVTAHTMQFWMRDL
jgi:GNAT superfamily N-acetyltransferase